MTDGTYQLRFPVGGLDITRAYADQRPRQISDGVYGRTCAAAMNVRGIEATKDRRRGGSRPGLKKHLSSAAVAGWLNQDLQSIVGAGTAVQTSQSGRVVYLTNVVQGVVYWSVVGSGTWAASTNNASGTPPLNFSGVMFSAANQQKLYYADGVNKVYWDPSNQSTNNWVASAGSFPVDSQNNTARLMETWRGRTLHAGFLKAPQDLTMSAQDAPNDYNVAPVPFVVTAAVELTTGQAGVVGDTVTGMIPWSDDLLLVGGNSTVKVLQGEPTDGGKMTDLTTSDGMLWGRAWARDPFGAVYWIGTSGTIYAWVPGNRPQEISTPIKRRLETIDTGAFQVRMIWDNKDRCLHTLVTKLAEPADTEHWTYETRTGAWQPFKFANTNHNPLAMCTVDGNQPSDRAILFGSWDGYVRRFDKDATDDDGTAIASYVVMGPINSPDFQEMIVDELLVDLGEASGQVTYSVYVGRTAEAALASSPVKTGTLSGSRNHAQPISRAGHAVYIRFSSTSVWALERIRLRVQSTGKVRARSRAG